MEHNKLTPEAERIVCWLIEARNPTRWFECHLNHGAYLWTSDAHKAKKFSTQLSCIKEISAMHFPSGFGEVITTEHIFIGSELKEVDDRLRSSGGRELVEKELRDAFCEHSWFQHLTKHQQECALGAISRLLAEREGKRLAERLEPILVEMENVGCAHTGGCNYGVENCGWSTREYAAQIRAAAQQALAQILTDLSFKWQKALCGIFGMEVICQENIEDIEKFCKDKMTAHDKEVAAAAEEASHLEGIAVAKETIWAALGAEGHEEASSFVRYMEITMPLTSSGALARYLAAHTKPLREALRACLAELGRLRVAYATKLQSHVEPPDSVVIETGEAALAPPASEGSAGEPRRAAASLDLNAPKEE